MADDNDDGLAPGVDKPRTDSSEIADIIRARINALDLSSEQHPDQEHFDRLTRRDWETDKGAFAIEAEALLGMIKKGRLSSFEFYQSHGFPMNSQSSRSGFTPLHMAALVGARQILRRLVKIDDLDYLARDYKGRLPSELAFVHAHDPAVARLLRKKEKQQGREQGIKVTRRPR